MDSVTEESFSLGTFRFREERLPIRDDFDVPSFAEYQAVAAPCGGALAFTKNPRSHLIVGVDTSNLYFFTAYGKPIASMSIKDWKDVKKTGWTLNEHFIVAFAETSTGFGMFNSSKIEVYSIMQRLVTSFAMPAVSSPFSSIINILFLHLFSYSVLENTSC